MKDSGDQLTALAVKLTKVQDVLQVFNPVYSFIDKSSGRLQRNMSITRDYAAIHSYLWDMTSQLEAYLNDADGDSAASLADYGIDYLKDTDIDPDAEEAINKIFKKKGKDWQMHFFNHYV